MVYRLNISSSSTLQEEMYDKRPRSFKVYAPCRTAVVYALIEDGSAEQAEDGSAEQAAV